MGSTDAMIGKRIMAAAAGLMLATLLVLWARQITGAAIEKDAAQSVRMAINLSHHGVVSLQTVPPFVPTNYREPLPVLVSALSVTVIDAILGRADTADYLSGPRVKYLKYQNLMWLTLLCAGAFFAARALGATPFFALAAVTLISTPYIASGSDIDGLNTEIPAAAMLMLAAWTLALAFVRGRLWLFALAGVLLGLLALIKAIALHVMPGIIVVLACLYFARRVAPGRVAVRNLAVFGIAFACVVTPWMCRNYVQLGVFQISQRSGIALLYRATYDRMTPEEYRGSFYVWSRGDLQKIMGKVLGYSPEDLTRTGRLRRLNVAASSDFAADDLAAQQAGKPEQAISYYRKVRAVREQLEQEIPAGRVGEQDAEVERRLKQHALEMIRADPWRHMAVTLPVLWRGASFLLPVLCASLFYALARRRDDWLVFALPQLGIIALYALVTEFNARFNAPLRPISVVLLVLLVQVLWERLQPAGRRFLGASPSPMS